MAKRMLIDATHSEETRVVVLSGSRVEEFDYESANKKQIKGNIYLAKVTKVEPSLQAAFVDYGGNRHGFLAFSEIHPDYYRIPIADREALIAEQAALHGDDGDDGDDEPPEEDVGEDAAAEGSEGGPAEAGEGPAADDGGRRRRVRGRRGRHGGGDVEEVGGDEMEEMRRRRTRSLHSYKIQEVIKRRQILLVQVSKEERGTKGAALTTYISLAGRYCVLMPNSPRGGGISRKISNASDRKKLKSILDELEVPEGMAVIVRTAGAKRSKAEIKRDFDYLVRTWDEIRDRTFNSEAPAVVHEEASLIKRSIRDLYSRDINEVLVDGDDGYKVAKKFMRDLIPSHAKHVQPYKDSGIPLFQRYQIESQLDEIHEPSVRLKSGGSIVLNATEALVAIDVNSGRATRERHIEVTALKTNLEAADEVARQLRLRDLAGLIVIDFIDMEEQRNINAVERRLKEAMRSDRARIQIGRISAFGLLELSRQRLRPSLEEASMLPCRHCSGTGMVRSTESTALHVLRAIEEEGSRQRSAALTITTPTEVALYILNQKRENLAEIETRYGFRVMVAGDNTLIPPEYRLERERGERGERGERAAAEPVETESAEGEEKAEESGRRRSRRGRRRRKSEDEAQASASEATADAEAAAPEEGASAAASDDQEDGTPKRRRRGKRGGRRRGRRGDVETSDDQVAAESGGEGSGEDRAAPYPLDSEQPSVDAAPDDADDRAEGDQAEEPERKPRRRRRKAAARSRDTGPADEAAPVAAESTGAAPAEILTGAVEPPDSQIDVFAELAPERAAASAESEPTAEPWSTLAAEGDGKEASPVADDGKKPRRSRRPRNGGRKTAAAEDTDTVDAPGELPVDEAGPIAVAEPAEPMQPVMPMEAAEPAETAGAVKSDEPEGPDKVADSDAPKPTIINVGDDGPPAGERRRGWWSRLVE